ncbi:MAG: hypothetical protein ABJB03_02540 [Rhodoglobus sp.]
MKRVGGLAVTFAAALLLAGCAMEPPPVPPGPTDAEIVTMVDNQNEQVWNSMFPGLPRPDIPVVEYVEGDRWTQAQVDCLVALGLDARAQGGGITVSGIGPSADSSNLAWYTCSVEYPYPLDQQPFFSDAQLAYEYDFFANRLAPCMRLIGYAVPPAPTKSAFVDGYYAGPRSWIPYYSVQPMIQDPAKWDEIDLRCGTLPEDPFGRFH